MEGMNFLPFILLWLVGIASGDNKWNACWNITSGERGVCLSEGSCVGIGGFEIGNCTSSVAENICCKILFVTDNTVKNTSLVTPSNINSSYGENKTNPIFSIRKPVLDISHEPENTVDINSTGKQLNAFQQNFSIDHNHENSTNKHSHNVDPHYYFPDNFGRSIKFDPKLYLKNYVSLEPKRKILNPVEKDPRFYPQLYNKVDLPKYQKLQGSNPRDNLEKMEKMVNGKDVSEPSVNRYAFTNTVQTHVINSFRKTGQTKIYTQKPVQVDSTHNLQKQVLTDLKKPNFWNTVKKAVMRDFKRSIIVTNDQDLRNPIPIEPTNDLRKSAQTDITFHLQKPVKVDPSHNLRKVVKVTDSHDLRRSPMPEPDHYLQNPANVYTVDVLHKSVNTGSTFHLRKPVHVDPSHNLHKEVKISESHDLRWPVMQEYGHDLRVPVQVYPMNDLRKPVQVDSTFYLQKAVQTDPSHNLRKVAKVLDSHYYDPRVPVQRHPTNDLRKPVQVDSTFFLQKPVQADPTHNLRKAVKVADSHDLRKPVQVDSTFYLQKPVQADPSHNLRKAVKVADSHDLRKPVQVDSTFYLQKPVQTDPSHNLRKAVKVADSHDLRWPIVQEPDHDLRNPVKDIDFFRSENAEAKLVKIIQAYAKNISKGENNKVHHDPIYELLHEDERIKSSCEQEFWSSTENGTRLDNRNFRTSQQELLFSNSTKVCGIPYNETTVNLDLQNWNSSMGPWMVSVQEYFSGNFRHTCAGSLLNSIWVITAAHCVDLRPKWDFLLKFGTVNKGESEDSIERLVNKISIHPKYNNMNFDNDIALLRMELPVTFQINIVPICLPDSHDSMEKRKAVVFGWQAASKRKMSPVEAQAETVPVLTNKECELMFSETGVDESIAKSFVCAGARSVKESCTGDSGGPLAVLDSRGRWSLAGLYSWGKSCKIPNQPEVYISVTSYVNWIEETISCFEHYISLGKING